MADNKEVKSKRDLFSDRMKGKYPDKQFDDDEALFGQINDDYDDYDDHDDYDDWFYSSFRSII